MAGSLDPMRSDVFNLRDLWVEVHQEGIIANGNFDEDSSWTKGAGWTIGSGKATHAGGAGDLSQLATLALTSYYEIIYTVTGRSAGTITPKAGTAAGTAQSTNDTFEERLTCAGNTNLVFSANAAFDGSVDVVSVTKILTEYWLYINSAVVQDKGIVKRSLQASMKDRRLTSLSHDYTLNLSRFQAKDSDDFGIITVSADDLYQILLIQINEQNPSLTETRTLKGCQLELRSIKMDALVNSVPTQWAVGEYDPP